MNGNGERPETDGESLRETNKVAIIRHGQKGRDELLTEAGKTQIQTVGIQLSRHLQTGELAAILSSTAPRAMQSSEILSHILQAPIEFHDILWPLGNREQDYPAVYQLLKSLRSKVELAVIVTHDAYVHGFPDFLTLQDFGEECLPPGIEEGEGILIDYKVPTVHMLGIRYV